MKKTILFSSLLVCLLTTIVFTPSKGTTNIQPDNSINLFSTCSGFIQASVECATEDPANATITIRNKETGALAYTGPADGNPAAVTLAPGVYVVSVATTGNCQFIVKWEFCGDSFDGFVPVNNGSAIVDDIAVC